MKNNPLIALLPYCLIALLPYCLIALLPYCLIGLLVFSNFSSSHQGQTDDTTAHAGYGGHNVNSANENGKYHEHTDFCLSILGRSSCAIGDKLDGVNKVIPEISTGSPPVCHSCFTVKDTEVRDLPIEQINTCGVTGATLVRETRGLFGSYTINEPTTSDPDKPTTISVSSLDDPLPPGRTRNKNYTIKWWCGKAREMAGDHRPGQPNTRATNPGGPLTYNSDGLPGASGQEVRSCSLLIPKGLRDDNTVLLPKERFDETLPSCRVHGDYFRVIATCKESTGPDKEAVCKTIIRKFIAGTITLKPGASITRVNNCCKDMEENNSSNNCKTWVSQRYKRRCWASLYDRRSNASLGDRAKGKNAYDNSLNNVNLILNETMFGPTGSLLAEALTNMQCLSNGMRQDLECECSSGYTFSFADRKDKSCTCCPGSTQDSSGNCSCPPGTALSSDGQFCECSNGSYKFPIGEQGDSGKCGCTCPGSPATPKPQDGDCCTVGQTDNCKACPVSGTNGCYTGATKTRISPANPTERVCTCPGGISPDSEGNCSRPCTDIPTSRITYPCQISQQVPVKFGSNYFCSIILGCSNSNGQCISGQYRKEDGTIPLDVGDPSSFELGIRILDTTANIPNRSLRCGSGPHPGDTTDDYACVIKGVKVAGSCTCSGNWKPASDNKCKASVSDVGTCDGPGDPVDMCQCTVGSYTYKPHTCVKSEGTACLDEKVRCKCPDGSPRPLDGICKCCDGKPMNMNQCSGCPGGCTKPCSKGRVECCGDPCPEDTCPNGELKIDTNGDGRIDKDDRCCCNGSPCRLAHCTDCGPCGPEGINMGDYNRSDLIFGNSALGQSFRSVYTLGRSDRPDFVCWECAKKTGSNVNTNLSDCSDSEIDSDYVERQRRDLYCPLHGVCRTDGKSRCKCVTEEGTVKENTYCEYANQDPGRRSNVSGETFDTSATQGQRLQIESTRTMTIIPPN